jgi:hypothetical protein
MELTTGSLKRIVALQAVGAASKGQIAVAHKWLVNFSGLRYCIIPSCEPLENTVSGFENISVE